MKKNSLTKKIMMHNLRETPLAAHLFSQRLRLWLGMGMTKVTKLLSVKINSLTVYVSSTLDKAFKNPQAKPFVTFLMKRWTMKVLAFLI